MNKDIKKNNRIPGCDPLTSPEEINELQKYLKKGIKKLEDETKLEKDAEDMKKDPRFKADTEIELEGKISVLDSRGNGNVSSLVDKKEWLDSGKDLDKLEEKISRIKNDKETTLVDQKEKLSGESEKVTEPIKFVFFADLHENSFGKNNQQLYNQIR